MEIKNHTFHLKVIVLCLIQVLCILVVETLYLLKRHTEIYHILILYFFALLEVSLV